MSLLARRILVDVDLVTGFAFDEVLVSEVTAAVAGEFVRRQVSRQSDVIIVVVETVTAHAVNHTET